MTIESQREDIFDKKLAVAGSITGLRDNIDTLARLMGSRRQALEALSQAAQIPIQTIKAIVEIPETIHFSHYINPLSGELNDPSGLFSDPYADTAMEATDSVFWAGFRQVLKEVMDS